jgi:hypothetical protein
VRGHTNGDLVDHPVPSHVDLNAASRTRVVERGLELGLALRAVDYIRQSEHGDALKLIGLTVRVVANLEEGVAVPGSSHRVVSSEDVVLDVEEGFVVRVEDCFKLAGLHRTQLRSLFLLRVDHSLPIELRSTLLFSSLTKKLSFEESLAGSPRRIAVLARECQSARAPLTPLTYDTESIHTVVTSVLA